MNYYANLDQILLGKDYGMQYPTTFLGKLFID